MGIHLYIRGNQFGLTFSNARRLDWEYQEVEVLRYGKKKKGNEMWCALYDAEEGGTELGRFRADDIIGFVSTR